MIAVVCLLAVLVVLQASRLVLAVIESERAHPTIENYVGHDVVVHKAGHSLRGIVKEADEHAVALVRASRLGSTVVPLDGTQVIERPIDFFQVLAPAGDPR